MTYSKKLYCSNYSLRKEVKELKEKYCKVNELINGKSRNVARLYELLQILREPEIKILLLLKEVENRNVLSLERDVVGKITDYKFYELEGIYEEFDNLIIKLEEDNITRNIMDDFCKYRDGNLGSNEKKKESNIEVEERYWSILK